MPLKGIKIIDLTRLLPGPYCTRLLADMGATVIKVEDKGDGDYLRSFPPEVDGKNVFFESLNRNKKGVTIDLQKEKGREIFLKLVEGSNILVEGFRPGVMDRLSLGYTILKERNPGLIYCAMTGYGQDSPYRERAGHDINYLALAGFLGLNTNPQGEPIVPGVQMADVAGGGLMAVIGILAALHHRNRTGEGQFVDSAMFDGAMSLIPIQISQALTLGLKQKPYQDMLNGGLACYNVYKTTDGRYMSLGALEAKFWANFCKAVERKELIADHNSMGKRGQKVKQEVSDIFKSRTQKEWLSFFKDKDCCCEPVLTVNEACSGSLARSRQMRIDPNRSQGFSSVQVGFPIKFSQTPSYLRSPAPASGQHNEEILEKIGYSAYQIDKLKKQKII